MPLLLLSIFLGIMGSGFGSAFFGELGLIVGSVTGFFAPSIVILWKVYTKISDRDSDDEIVVNNDADDDEEPDHLIGDEWRV